MNNKIKVKCPKCKKTFNYFDSESRPFCSEKCRLVDLGKWLNEEFAIKESFLCESIDVEKETMAE